MFYGPEKSIPSACIKQNSVICHPGESHHAHGEESLDKKLLSFFHHKSLPAHSLIAVLPIAYLPTYVL